MLYASSVAIWVFYALWYRSPAYILGGALLIPLAWLAGSRSFETPSRLSALPIQFGLLLGAGLTLWSLLRYLYFSDIGDVDMACYTQAFWSLGHGKLYLSLYENNYFSGHSNYLSVVFLPVYFLAGNVGLLLAQGLLLTASALLLLRRIPGLGLLPPYVYCFLIAAVFLSPPIASKFLFGFHADVLGIPLLVLALLDYRDGRLGRFLILCALMAFCKEIYTLAVAGLVLLSVLDKRDWRWAVYPSGMCLLLMGVYWFALAPLFAVGTGNQYGGWMPHSAMAWLSFFPRTENLAYLFRSLAPFLPLIALGGRRYLVLPAPLLFFYMGFEDPSFRETWRHYSLPVGFLCAGWLLFLKKEDLGKVAMPFLLGVALSYPSWRPLQVFPAWNASKRESVQEIARILPKQASLLVHGPFVSHLAGRENIMIWEHCPYPMERFEYILLDMRFHPPYLGENRRLGEDFQRLRNAPDWGHKEFPDSLFLFHRNGKQSLWEDLGDGLPGAKLSLKSLAATSTGEIK